MARKSKQEQYNYVLQFIEDSITALEPAVRLSIRTTQAFQGRPSMNSYSRAMSSWATELSQTDPERSADIRKCAADLPSIENKTVYNAVETVVAQTMGGPGQYEYLPYDPSFDMDSETFDRITGYLESVYDRNYINSLTPSYVRQAILDGSSYLHIRPNADGSIDLKLLKISDMILDPDRFRSNKTKFRGFKQRESWSAVKDRITKTKSGYLLKSLNEVDTYLSDIARCINGDTSLDKKDLELLQRDLDIFYRTDTQAYKNMRDDKHEAYDPEAKYNGDDIEISYVYDHINNYYFEVVNRKYIVVAKQNPLNKKISKKSGKTSKERTIMLEDPFVELGYMYLPFSRYPVTPLFYILNDFDNLCGMESVLYHTLSIMSPLTFVGKSDASYNVSRIASISGEIVDGMPQTFGVLSKSHDVSPTIAAIQRVEERIKRMLGATDPFEMAAMVGDRATAREVSAVGSQVSERNNQFIANIESAMACLADKIIKMTIMFSDKNKKLTFTAKGKYAEMDVSDLLADYGIRVRLNSSVKMERAQKARNALELISYIVGVPGVDAKKVFGTMIPIMLDGFITREQAEEMIGEPEEERVEKLPEPTPEELNQQGISNLPLDGVDVDQLMAQMAQGNAAQQSAQPTPEDLAMMQAMQQQGPQLPPFSEEGGVIANDPAGY